MRPALSRRRLLQAASVGAAAGVAGCLDSGGDSPESAVRSHRDALSTYADVSTAIDDGYTMTTPYVRTDGGVLGLPFYNSGAPELDPERPNVLFYDLNDDGTFSLLGVEWLVPADAADEPPSMFGTRFHDATPGETAFLPEHYGLHAWLFEENPDGLFAASHAGVEPPTHVDDLAAAWSALTAFFSDETAAVEAGYEKVDQCVSTPDGGYGYPFVNTDYWGTDPERPAVLLYRFSSSWSFRLVGAEWSVPAASADGPPSLFGATFHEPTAGHDPEGLQGAHYGLHAWLFTANPAGTFADFNPVFRC